MDGAQGLGLVGLPDPGGHPAVLREHAESWQELATHLQEQQDRLGALVARSQEQWQGGAADTFHERALTFLASSDQAVETANSMADAQRQHADQHQQVLEIVEELAIQIAVTLAFIVAATLFAPLLSFMEAELELLVTAAGRMVSLLDEILSELVRFLVRARQLIEQFSKLTLRTERFSFGYGRLLADGAKDFSIDLMANAITSAIEHEPLSTERLFTSAAVSFGVGGLFGALEASGLKKALTETGRVKRGEDGLPSFISFGDQYKKALNSLGGREAPHAANPARPAADDAGAWGEYATARGNARALDATGGAATGARMADDWAAAQARHRLALDRLPSPQLLSAAEARVVDTGNGVRVATARLTDAEGEAWTAQTLFDLHREIANPEWTRGAEEQLAEVRAQCAAWRQELTGRQALHGQAAQELATARHRAQTAAADVAREAQAYQAAANRSGAWHRLSTAADRVRTETSLGERFTYTWRNNTWRQAFGHPKSWPEFLFFEGTKDFAKGFSSSLTQAGIGVAQGTKSLDNIWKDALLGGAGGMTRGIVKGRFTNIAFPGGGIEEMLWKVGTKGLDKYIRDQIKNAIDLDGVVTHPTT
ncbi:WXG100-like domain-containing protein [Streptomyces sp. NPDC005122]